MVRFAIRNGRATFSGARNLTVVTNAAGRAAATGLVPTGNGALQPLIHLVSVIPH
jgi:hypothetical protein